MLHPEPNSLPFSVGVPCPHTLPVIHTHMCMHNLPSSLASIPSAAAASVFKLVGVLPRGQGEAPAADRQPCRLLEDRKP